MIEKPKDGISLKKLLQDKTQIMVLPGVYDALSAKIAEHVGFKAMFQTGYGSSATLLGMPDFGFLTAAETVENAQRIAGSVNAHVIVDADTGYGNPLTVWRLVHDLESVGAAGIFLEDQIWPKRCGHMTGKEVISREEYLPKLKAALDARKKKDFIIVARTDARAPLGIEEAIKRAKSYDKVGADAIFIEAPRSIKELKKIAGEIEAPLVANMIEQGMTPNLNAQQLLNIGYRMALFPLSGLYAATYALRQVFYELKKKGTTKHLTKRMVPFRIFNELLGLNEYMSLEKRYAT
jgi:2,3-dimethylmalate lyase